MQITKAFCVAVVSFLSIGCSSMQLYYIKDAKMIALSESNKENFAKNRPESVRLLLNGHYVKSGDSLVLIVRRFDKGRAFTVDDEIYEKITIEIKNYTLGKPIKLDSPDIHFYYSSGSSGFVSKGHGVYSTTGSGNIVVNKVDKDTIAVEFNLTILAEPAGLFPFEGRKVQVQDLLSFKEKQLSDLSPWLGIPDPAMGKEVYP
jgi:hypothetical protein